MKKVLSITLALLMLITTVLSVSSVSAATAGSSISNAVSLSEGTTGAKTWSNGDQNTDYYVKITASTRGFINFTINSSSDAYGNHRQLHLELFDVNGNHVWDACTLSNACTFKIGVTAGTYYMNVKREFSISSGTASVSFNYTVTANSYAEIESNNTQASATALKLDNMFYGSYCEEYSRSYSYSDFYKISLTSGSKYKIKIKNYEELSNNNTSFIIVTPDGLNDCCLTIRSNASVSGTTYSFNYTAQQSGTYYIKMYSSSGKAPVDYQIGVFTAPISASNLNVSLSTTTYTYDGNSKKPSVTVKTKSGSRVDSSNYTVTYPSGRTKVGSYTVTIKFKNKYSGTIKKTFKIRPKSTSISSISGIKAGLKVSWSKRTTQTSGYQIKIATNSGFSSGVKTYTISGTSTTSKSISSLTRNKRYYVKVRTYKTVDGTKYYSAWSNYKTIVTK